MNDVMRCLVLLNVCILTWVGNALAQVSSGTSSDPNQVVTNYSTQVITIIKGPIAKLLSFVILLMCVGALLRGRHRIALSCGVAFIVLLFLQVI